MRTKEKGDEDEEEEDEDKGGCLFISMCLGLVVWIE